MKFAVIRISGKQHKVFEGDEVLVDFVGETKPNIEVLLYSENGRTKVGKPTLKDINMKVKVVEKEEKGKKLYVSTFKAKSRYRRKIGFRPRYTRIKVESIN
jgi:ribosomal protein L21